MARKGISKGGYKRHGKRYGKRRVSSKRFKRLRRRASRRSKQLIKQQTWEVAITVQQGANYRDNAIPGTPYTLGSSTTKSSAIILSLHQQRSGATMAEYNWCIGQYPIFNSLSNFQTALRGNKGYFKSQTYRVTMWQDQSTFQQQAGNPPQPQIPVAYDPLAGNLNGVRVTPIQGWRIVFVRPRQNGSLLIPGIDNIARLPATATQISGMPLDFKGQFSAQFMQVFKILKDKCYYISTGAPIRNFSAMNVNA